MVKLIFEERKSECAAFFGPKSAKKRSKEKTQPEVYIKIGKIGGSPALFVLVYPQYRTIKKESDKMTLGEKISRQRKDKNYTQEQLAELLGVSDSPSANGSPISPIPKPKN